MCALRFNPALLAQAKAQTALAQATKLLAAQTPKLAAASYRTLLARQAQNTELAVLAVLAPGFAHPASVTYLPKAVAPVLGLPKAQTEPQLEPQPSSSRYTKEQSLAIAAGSMIASRFNLSLPAGTSLGRIRNSNWPQSGEEWLYLDIDQLRGVELALEGKSFVISGKAGCGKTTLLQAISIALAAKASTLGWRAYGYHPRGTAAGTRRYAPPIALVTFTNKAVGVIKQKVLSNPQVVDAGFGANIQTCHALLEFAPEYVWSEKQEREVRLFRPQRTKHNTLHGLKAVLVDEASMVGVGEDLTATQIWNYLYEALEQDTQVILVGDIHQLPPVGGKSVLSYGLQQLPVHELKHFHRQALESPVLAVAHSVLEGKFPKAQHNARTGSYFKTIFSKPEQLQQHKSATYYNAWLAQAVTKWLASGSFNPETDVFLVPYNKKHSKDGSRHYVNTKSLNAAIATQISLAAGREVYQVIAGFEKLYLAVGDRVLVDKQEAVVTRIEPNRSYWGKRPQPAAIGVDYETGKLLHGATAGVSQSAEEALGASADTEADYSNLDLDSLSAAINGLSADSNARTEMQQQASHKVYYTLVAGDDDTEWSMSGTGEFAEQYFQLAYALTAHKAQGSEWDKVIVVLHPSHATMVSREWLYTASTRARSQLVWLGIESTFRRAVGNARIKGESLQEKIEFFNNGYLKPTDFSKLAS